MIQRFWNRSLMIWAARDLLRRPLQAVLLFAALVSVVSLLALLLTLQQTIGTAQRRLMADTPAVVVQRVDNNTWRPLPVDAAMSRIKDVAGVMRPRVRIWGIVQGPQGPLTVMAATPEICNQLPGDTPTPGPGQALASPGVAGREDTRLALTPPGRPAMTFTVNHRLPADSALGFRATVILHPSETRALLGLTPTQATDLALDVFHEEEAQAMVPDIARTLGWPVKITTRSEQLARALTHLSRRTGMLLLTFVPALLAMLLLVAALGAWGRQRHWEMGLFKAVGWTGADILQLFLYQGMLVGLPALLVGTGCACLLLYLPTMTWVSRLLFDWEGPPPLLFFEPQMGLLGLFLSLFMAGVPYLTTIFWTGWQAAITDPADGLTEGRG